MTEYVCKYMPRCKSRMFTQGHAYPVVGVEGRLEAVRDDYGFVRYLLKDSPEFIVQNDYPNGEIYQARFERREVSNATS